MKIRMRIIAVLCVIVCILCEPQLVKADMSETEGSDMSAFVLSHEQKYRNDDSKSNSIIYIMYGGINNWKNPMHFSEGETVTLRIPFRYGYTFAGWYLDKKFTKKIEEIPANWDQNIVLYAKWNDNIDNTYNVEHYKYRSSQRLEKSTIRLKDCEYSFCENVNIPGMPATREDDFLNNYIFSESQCPQGICLTDAYIMITSYSTEDDCLGELLIFDRETGEYLVTIGLDANSHLGGIAFDGDNVWVCNSYTKSVERISYDFIQLMANENRGGVIDATDVVDIYKVSNTPSCITYYGGRLWIATHTIYLRSKVVAYYYDRNNNELNTLGKYTIPRQVQGITFGDDGSVYLSTSYGRNESSYVKKYNSVIAMSTKPGRPQIQVEMPPGSEEIDFQDDSLYLLFESAGEKYYEGTDGKGTSSSPIDKILKLNVESLEY